jgi:hypothetical protein
MLWPRLRFISGVKQLRERLQAAQQEPPQVKNARLELKVGSRTASQ